jgi:hypothetical protein
MKTPRKTIIDGVLLLSLFVPSLLAQSNSPVFSDPKKSGFFKPKLTIEGGATFDFGDIYRGQKVSHLFTIKNEGTDTLVISNVSASCGCTAGMVSTRTIPPRGTSDLNVSFDSHGYSGGVVKTVTITSNDPVSPSVQAAIKANVITVFESSPSFIFVQSAKIDSTSTASIELKNGVGKAVKILSIESGVSGLKAEVAKKTVKPGDSTTLKAIFKPTKEGMTYGEVTIKTDFAPQPDLSIRFTANVHK